MQSFDPERFLAVRETVLESDREDKGIGTLGERTLHAILKAYYEPMGALHEQKLGRYVADILNEEGITEIQTRSLSTMRPKLEAFLSVAHVTVVHPVVRKKWILRIDPETGEVLGRRKSPKEESVYDAFWELYGIKDYLLHPNLTVCICILDMEELRLINIPKKRRRGMGTLRVDRIPTALIGETRLATQADYGALLPDTLPDEFTKKELSAAVGVPTDRLSSMLRVLTALGVIAEFGKRGREKVWRRQ